MRIDGTELSLFDERMLVSDFMMLGDAVLVDTVPCDDLGEEGSVYGWDW